MDTLRALLESDAITEQMKTEIQEAWDTKIRENRIAVTAELREEFAQKYEHDKSVMVEAIDALIGEKLSEEMTEFHEDRKQLAEAKARYAVAMRENTKLVKKFVAESLAKEVSELHEDQKEMAKKFAVLEEFIVEQLAKELAEFQEDKKDLAETKVRLVREAKAHFAKVKQTFIERTTKLVAETVEKGLKSEIHQLKEDIEVARKNDFGRKVFEAFSSEYLNSHLNEKSESKKLLKVLEAKDKQLAEAKKLTAKAVQIAESKGAEVKRLAESREREKVMNELVAPLSKDQRAIMTDLLESVQTSRLRSAFEKYIPAVIDGKSPAKQKAVLSEGKEITGNRENSSIKQASDSNVFDIKRLAGLK
jgi:hypothetical protein